MPMELRRVYLGSAVRMAFALVIANGAILALPMIWYWIDTGTWVTGFEMGPGMFAIGALFSIVGSAIATAIVAAVFVVVYKVVARNWGGVEVSPSGP